MVVVEREAVRGSVGELNSFKERLNQKVASGTRGQRNIPG